MIKSFLGISTTDLLLLFFCDDAVIGPMSLTFVRVYFVKDELLIVELWLLLNAYCSEADEFMTDKAAVCLVLEAYGS